jgi:murein DD-endopeptidase MepM/ murein hydrolase activator NlpD
VVNTNGDILNVRPQPNTDEPPIGVLAAGRLVDVLDIDEAGQEVDGVATWYLIASGPLEGWISGAFATCTTDEPLPALDGFLLPLSCGTSVGITQGNHSPFSHNGKAAFAFDFGLPADTPLLAMADGVVVLVKDDITPGHPCYSGGGSECANNANYVVLDHGDGTATLYLHLNAPAVAVGDAVLRGAQIGLSGGTGWSTGPHAHVQRQELCSGYWCQSVELSFADVGGDGIPEAGDVVVSENGC